jgi:hypothetical protein
MPPRNLFLVLLSLLAALAVMAACGGGDDDDDGGGGSHQLTDPETVPTVTPWQQLPDPIVLDPNNIQPLPPTDPNTNGGAEETATPEAGEPGVCGETYTVVGGDTAFGIGEKCGWPSDDLDNFVTLLEELNPDIDVRSLSIDQVLVMPPLPADDGEPEETSQ